jgi:hypothetical protein
MNGISKTFLVTVFVGAVIYAIVEAYVDAHFFNHESGAVQGNGTNQPPTTSGSDWTNAGYNGDLNMEPQGDVYNGPGRQSVHTNFNGQIYTKKFHPGGNPNSIKRGEHSYAFQTATKNPFANGTYNGYQDAVDSATSDPTNNATALVKGPGQSVNNDNS